MIRCVRASVNSVGLCRLAELYGRALVTIRVGGVALFFCYDCAGTVHIKRDSGRRDVALGGCCNVGKPRADPWRCIVHVDLSRGVSLGNPMRAVAIARDRRRNALPTHTHIHRARFLRGSRRAVKAMASSSACAMRWPRRLSKRLIE